MLTWSTLIYFNVNNVDPLVELSNIPDEYKETDTSVLLQCGL